MRLPQFSEFSFGYALTDNLINGVLPKTLKAAPTFPSLYKEGKLSGGYDVKIPLKSAPLFLQFKIPQIITRKSKNTPPSFRAPYYRMHLRPGGQSLQHLSLLLHGRRHKLVYYVTPRFHTTRDLNAAFFNLRMIDESVFIRPSQIGSLDGQEHFVAYDLVNPVAWLFSEPHSIQGAIDGHRFVVEVQEHVRQATRPTSTADTFDSVASDIIRTYEESVRKVEAKAREEHWQRDDTFTPTWQEGNGRSVEEIAASAREEASSRYSVAKERYGPAGGAAYLARIYLDCELIIIVENDEN